MSTSSTVINQLTEVVTVICRQAVAFNGILSRLQTLYPATGWTDALLTLRLNQGVRQGLFKAIGSNPAGPVDGYGINPNALRLNYSRNVIYEPFCNNLLPMGCAPSCGIVGTQGGC